MLYLNSVENVVASKTEKKYAICYEKIASMQNITALAPSKKLLSQWQLREITWEAFRQKFTDEVRAAYCKKTSELRKVIQYSLENDVTLHSPEPSGAQTYRAVLEEIINNIWQQEGRSDRVINLVGEPFEAFHLTAGNRERMQQIAARCEFFSPVQLDDRLKTCQQCEHLDQQVYMCPTTNQVVVNYEWTAPAWVGVQA